MGMGTRRKGWCTPFAALILFALTAAARAADGGEKASELNTVRFGSLDGGRSAFMNAGVKRAFEGSLDRDGFIAMSAAGAGGAPERDPVGFGSIFRPTAQAYAMLGYQWMLGPVTVSALAGPELDAETDSPNAWRSARTRFGLRGHAELWAHPTPQTLATATLIAGSARGHVWSRISGGYAFWRGVFIGPEASFYASDDYREWRLGAHVTGLKWGRFNFRLSGGFFQANDDHNGAYFGLTGYVRM
jgi:Cellulose biosynthesis protein BcsS